MVYSKAGEIVAKTLVIDSHPQNFYGAMGEQISFTVEARGEGLTYQWQVSANGGTTWGASTAAGLPMTVTYNGTTYYYATNLQGDVIAILNTSGAPMVQYTYDAWGIEPDRREAEAREGADCAAVGRSQGAPTTQAAVGSPQTESSPTAARRRQGRA